MCKIPELRIQWSPLEDVREPTYSENHSRNGKDQTFILSFLFGYLRASKLLRKDIFYRRILAHKYRKNYIIGTSSFCIP